MGELFGGLIQQTKINFSHKIRTDNNQKCQRMCGRCLYKIIRIMRIAQINAGDTFYCSEISVQVWF